MKTSRKTFYGLFYPNRGALTGPLDNMVFHTPPDVRTVLDLQKAVKKTLTVKKLKVV